MIRVNSKSLASMLEDVKPAFASRPCMPILSHILVEANGKLQLTGTDLSTGIRTYLDLQSEVDFSAAVPFRAFRDVVRAACGEITLSIDPESSRFVVQDAHGKHGLGYLDSMDYPAWSGQGTPTAWVHVQDVLTPMNKVIHAMSRDNSRFNLNSLHLNGAAGTIFATDGHRHTTEPVDWLPADLLARVDGAAAKSTVAALKRCKGWLDISVSQNTLTFTDGIIEVLCRMTRISEEEVARLTLPLPEFHNPVRVKKADLLKGLKICKVILSARLNAVTLWLDSDSITLKSEDTDLGYAAHVIDAQVPDSLIGKACIFNLRYLQDALKDADKDVELEFSEDLLMLKIGEEVVSGMRFGSKPIERPDYSIPVPKTTEPKKLHKKSRCMKKAA